MNEIMANRLSNQRDNRSGQNESDDLWEMLFDDEPLEQLLYSHNPEGGSSASLYRPARGFVERIKRCYAAGDLAGTLREAIELGSTEHPFSKDICLELAIILREFVPDYPQPILHIDLAPLKPLVGRLWEFIDKKRDKLLVKKAGSPIYRCYEHIQSFQEARSVLKALLRICREEKDRGGEATFTNNFGFEYLLEERWKEAMPHFKKAALLFKESGYLTEWANVRANYWTCRFETDKNKCIHVCAKEMPKLHEILE
jgi:hypothetical protein